MKTVYHVKIIEPLQIDVGIFSNKSIAFDRLQNLLSNNTRVFVDEDSVLFESYKNKTVNYVNFTKYFKEVKHKQNLTLKCIKFDSDSIKRIRITKFNINE